MIFCYTRAEAALILIFESHADKVLWGFEMADKYEEIVQALNTRLAELTGNVAEIDSELRKPLSARNEEQATDLENQDALEGIEKSKLQEIQQIELALRRIAEGVLWLLLRMRRDHFCQTSQGASDCDEMYFLRGVV